MSQGYTISPVADEQGNIVDFNVDGGYQGFRSNQEDIVEFNDGSRHHVFEDASIDEGEFTTDSYYETLAASDERIPAALEWAAGNLPPELIAEYNESLDNDEVDTTHRILEYILENYPGDEYNSSEEEYTSEEEELTEDDYEELSSVVEDLIGNEPQGEEVAVEWQQWSDQAAANGNEVAAAIGAATAAFNAGECDAETAIQFVLDNYNLRDIEQAYRLITNQ